MCLPASSHRRDDKKALYDYRQYDLLRVRVNLRIRINQSYMTHVAMLSNIPRKPNYIYVCIICTKVEDLETDNFYRFPNLYEFVKHLVSNHNPCESHVDSYTSFVLLSIITPRRCFRTTSI